MLYLLFSAFQFGSQLSTSSLSVSDREAMLWVRGNTPQDSRFLVLTGTNSISCDLVLEWFPALADRQSIFTVQGTEWTKGPDFVPYVRSTYAVQGCLTDGDLSCLDSAVPRSQYDYIYLSRLPRVNCRTVEFKHAFHPFLESLRMDPQFHSVYETDRVIIYTK
jgi:hypothetical protein